MSVARPIAFLSDFGLEDEFVGICHAVMARIAPSGRVIDLSHAIAPQDVLGGALALLRATPYLPAEAIVLGVVDPGVGTERRPVAVETVRRSRLLVLPDNGLGSLVWRAEDGVGRAVTIEAPDVVLTPVSATFHGRDVFAPAAAHLATGKPLEALGEPVDPASLVEVRLPEPGVEWGEVAAEVLGVDRFGNVETSARLEHLRAAGLGAEARLAVEAGGVEQVATLARAFGHVAEGALGLIEDSSGWLAVVVNRGSAAEVLGAMPGDPIVVRRPAG